MAETTRVHYEGEHHDSRVSKEKDADDEEDDDNTSYLSDKMPDLSQFDQLQLAKAQEDGSLSIKNGRIIYPHAHGNGNIVPCDANSDVLTPPGDGDPENVNLKSIPVVYR